MRRRTPALFLSLALAAPAFADPPASRVPASKIEPPGDEAADRPAPDEKEAPAPNYQGVQLGAERQPPGAPRAPRANAKGPARMTWIGFQVRQGVPTVFVQLSRPVAWSVVESEGKLVYTLVGATIPLANNRRPIDVSAFNTPIQLVEAKRQGKDAEVTIQFKGKVTHRERNETAPAGSKFLVVELPPVE